MGANEPIDSDVLFNAILKTCKDNGVNPDKCQLGTHINELIRLIGYDLLQWGIKLK